MPDYRCYALRRINPTGTVIVCKNDASARAIVRRYFPRTGVEIWDGLRNVGSTTEIVGSTMEVNRGDASPASVEGGARIKRASRLANLSV